MYTIIQEYSTTAGKTNISFLDWVNNNKQVLFDFFAEQSPYFPYHCVDIAYVLGQLYEQQTGDKAMLWKVVKKHYKTNWHIVLEVDNHMIDLSLFQFYAVKTHIKKIPKGELYAFCIEECQNGHVIFPKKAYLTRFKEDVIIHVDLQEDIGKHFKFPRSWYEDKSPDEAIRCLRENGWLKNPKF